MRTIFKCLHGSHLYGLNTENSDKDFKGVFIPSMEDVLLERSPQHLNKSTGNDRSKNSSEDIDEVSYSLKNFLKMLCDGETIAIDMLHASSNPDCVIETSSEWEFIYRNRDRFYSSQMNAFMGYCKKQAAKYGIKGSKIAALEEILYSLDDMDICDQDKLSVALDKGVPENEFCKIVTKEHRGDEKTFYSILGSLYQDSITVEEFETLIRKKLQSFGDRARLAKQNEGVDWKAISHAIRAGYQLEEIYKTGDLKYPLKNRDYLLQVKKGELDFVTEVQPELERIISEVEVLANNSHYSKKVDREFWDEFILDVYEEEMVEYIRKRNTSWIDELVGV